MEFLIESIEVTEKEPNHFPYGEATATLKGAITAQAGTLVKMTNLIKHAGKVGLYTGESLTTMSLTELQLILSELLDIGQKIKPNEKVKKVYMNTERSAFSLIFEQTQELRKLVS
jgi:hypothetical protein